MDSLFVHNFVYVPVLLTITENGKKALNFPFGWKTINQLNYRRKYTECVQLHGTDVQLAVKTGEISNCTVLDFDDADFYHELLDRFPVLNTYLTCQTKNGYHIYFDYDEDLKSPQTNVIEVDNVRKKVDIRSNNALALCPPSTYALQDGTTFTYQWLPNGVKKPLPDFLRNLIRDECKVLSRKRTRSILEDDEEVEVAPVQVNYDVKQFEMYEKIAPLISVNRLNRYDDWFSFTCAVFNTFGEAGKYAWRLASSQCTTFDDTNNNRIWNGLRTQPLRKNKKFGFSTIVDYAKADNKCLYEEILAEIVGSSIIWDDLSQLQFALVMKQLYFSDGNLIFKTKSATAREGYMFNETYWRVLEPCRATLTRQYFPLLKTYFLNALSQYGVVFGEKEIKHYKEKISMLGNYNFQNQVFQLVEKECFKTDTEVEWNVDKDLFAFEDVVFNVRTGEFVDALPSQYINTTCGYNFFSYDSDGKKLEVQPQYAEEKQHILDFFDSIFINSSIRKFFLSEIACYMSQHNVDEKALFLLGVGRNGKGASTILIEGVFGNYFQELRLGYYTAKESGSVDAPNNNLFYCRNARILNTSEVGHDQTNPDKPMMFMTERFKTLTGQDLLTARQPHGTLQVTFRAGHPIIQTNVMPVLKDIHLPENVSLRARIQIIEFPYSFVSDEALIQAEPFKYKRQNAQLKSLFQTSRYRDAFVRLLLEQCKQPRVPVPQEVEDYKLKYFEENDEVRKYFTATFEALPVEGNTDFTKMDRFDLNELKTSSNVNRNFKQFRSEMALIAGSRDRDNSKTSRGIYQNRNNWFLQGYRYKNIEEGELEDLRREHNFITGANVVPGFRSGS
jgi:phage/plasmid-associated DNA primase